MSVMTVNRRKVRVVDFFRFAALVILAIIALFPLAWMISGSLKPLEDVFTIPVKWIPNPIKWENYPNAWNFGQLSFTTNLINSTLVMVAQIILQVSFCALAGFGFAKHEFPGKELLFIIVLSMTLLPLQIIMIPLFVIIKQLGWIDTYQGLIVPTAVSAFGVFFMRQFITAIPRDYIDAARVDGASELGIFLRVVVPMSVPAIVTLALLTGLASWDEFLWPLIVVTDQKYATLPLGISYLRSSYEAPANWLLAVSMVAVLPPLIAFFFAQRQIMESQARTGLKG